MRIKKAVFIIWVMFFLAGCVIIPREPGSPAPGVYRPISTLELARIVGPKRRQSKWRYITLHHSATFEGGAESFDRNHRDRNMGGLFYHFVIGNGSRSGNGEIETGWRWKEQQEVKRACDIQICLVGNFNKEFVSSAQFDSLIKLINLLRKQYNIPVANIYRHKDVAERYTECPGENFPFYRLLRDLRNSNQP
jgi:hypothetical protein